MSEYFTDTITHIPVVKDVTTGAETAQARVDYSCQIEDHNEVIGNIDGVDIVSKVLIFVSSSAPINKGDRIILKNRWSGATGDSTEYVVVRVNRPDGFSESQREILL